MQRRILNWTTIILLFVVNVNLRSQNVTDTFKIKGANNEKLRNYYSFYEDPNDNLSLKQIVGKLNEGKFIRKKKGNFVFNSGYTHSSYWFALPIKNDTSVALPLLWSFYQNNLGYVLYDVTHAVHPVIVDSIISNQPMSQRKFSFRSPAFQIDLPAHAYRLLLVKVFLVNADVVYFPSDLTTVDDVLLWEINYSFLLGQYMGYFILVCVFNIFLWRLLKARIHLWQSLYVFMIILYSLSENMYDILYLPDWLYPYFNRLPKTLFLTFAIYFGIIVFQIFTSQKSNFPKFYVVFGYLKTIILVASTLLLFGSLILKGQAPILYISRIIIDVIFYLGLLFLVIFIIYGLIKKSGPVVSYLFAIVFLVIAYIDYASVNIFDFQLFYIRPGNILIGLAIEITLLTALLIIKFNKERKKIFLDLENKNLENLKLTQNIITIQEEERKRIAEDLHDDIGATLSALHLHISSLPDDIIRQSQRLQEFCMQSLSLAFKAAADVRSISHDLLPKDFTQMGLFAVLQNKMDELNASDFIDFTLISDGDEKGLNNIYSITIYRIINELINNIIRHSQAQKALIQVLISASDTQVIAEDNGIGIGAKNNKTGIGMKNIKSRVDFLKGKLNIDSNEKGTTVIIIVPLPEIAT